MRVYSNAVRSASQIGWALKRDDGVNLKKSQKMPPHELRYAVVIESGDRNYSAYVPICRDVRRPGRLSNEGEIREAIRFHIAGLREEGQPVSAAKSL
jgi:predicted RNase H-like HicB family nuclease